MLRRAFAPQQMKIRLYLLEVQGLTAQQNVVNIKDVLAGYRAVSSANPYPEISVGDKQNSGGFLKRVQDKESTQNNELNPKFYKTYELDCLLPHDLNLELSVKSK